MYITIEYGTSHVRELGTTVLVPALYLNQVLFSLLIPHSITQKKEKKRVYS